MSAYHQHVLGGVILAAVFLYLAFKFGEANARVKLVSRRRTGEIDLTLLRRIH